MRLKEGLNSKGITAAAMQESMKKQHTSSDLNATGRESMTGDAHVNCCVDSFYPFVSIVFFLWHQHLPKPNQATTIKNNRRQQRLLGKLTFSPSYLLPYLSHKEFIDTMGLMSPACFSTWTFICIKASSRESTNL